MTKTCFVIMPIQKAGTPEHEYYQALYRDFLKPTLMLRGYEVERADETQTTGAITKDIIVRLAEADVVLADLTSLNPNVFYELGVRHSLRGKGTIMILDALRTNQIPFDLGAYRVIQFEGKVEGLGKLRQELDGFVSTLNNETLDRRDNPVHDWLPTLPLNALETATGATESRQRARIGELEAKLDLYRSKYGAQDEQMEREKISPIEIIKAARAEVSAGNSPFDLIRQAEDYVQQQNIANFLEVVEKIFRMKMIRLTSAQYLTLIVLTGRLGLDEVITAIFEYALEVYPTDSGIRRAQLNHFAHSPLPVYRSRARKELLTEIGLVIKDDGAVVVPSTFNYSSAALLGVMLDAYHRDQLHAEALKITTALIENHAGLTTVARNHARALMNAQLQEEALTWYQRAIWCSDVDDTSVAWLGSDLHNRERHVDALEAYVLACLTDPNDASYFAQAADELSVIMKESFLPNLPDARRKLPDAIYNELTHTAEQALLCALSCPDFSQDDLQLCRRAASKMEEIDFELLLRLRMVGSVSAEESGLRLYSLSARVGFAKSVYGALKSSVTEPPKLIST